PRSVTSRWEPKPHSCTHVRAISPTNRSLLAEVNPARFRSALYSRLAVVKVHLPPLRQRPDDLPAICDYILDSLGASKVTAASLRTPEFIASLRQSAWPGNVRELRNYLERCLVFQEALPMAEELPVAAHHTAIDARLS